MFSRRARLSLTVVALAYAATLFGFAWARFATFHNRTFDLALYARIAWGLAHADTWSPVLNTHVLGAHLSPVLLPLGLLGRAFGVVPVLLVAQALCVGLSVFPLARVGARRLGTRGIVLATVAALLYPNLFHVATYEFHPGTLAVLPMCWAFDAVDRRSFPQLAGTLAATLACREDLGFFAALMALVFFLTHRDRRALVALALCLAYASAALAIIARHTPSGGSPDLHFGPWGGSPLGIVRSALEDPARVYAHLRERVGYLPRVLAPLSFFSLRAPRLLLPALPYLALNLVSVFPTADEQYSHYLTPAVPAILASGIVGVTAARARFVRVLWFLTLGIAHHALGGSPLSRDFDGAAYFADDATRAARAVLAHVPSGASVQAPDSLLPHLAERRELRRGPPPEAHTDLAIVDVSHRDRYARKEELLRTSEEPLVRRLLARPDRALLAYEPPYALFERGRDARSTEPFAACITDAAPPTLLPLTRCLGIARAQLTERGLELTLRASGACPADLALRLGADSYPGRVELLCTGRISPALLRPGDVVRSIHAVTPTEREALRSRGLWVGALRASGAPPEPSDPPAVRVPLSEEKP